MAAVDSRYARALAAVLQSQKLNAEVALRQVRDFAATLEASPDLRAALENPSIPEDQKLRVLDSITTRLGLFPSVRNFIAVITSHGRLPEFASMVDAYAAVADETSGVADAEIISAHPLDAHNKSLLEQQVARLAGGTEVRATYSEDASLLGGAIVRIGSTVYDGSVRAQLQQMKQRLIAAKA